MSNAADFTVFLKKLLESLKNVTGFATRQQMTTRQGLFSYSIDSDLYRHMGSAGGWDGQA